MNIQQNRITALYCRLSRDDDFGGDSASIQTQKTMLSQYARDNGFTVTEFYVDDGYSGTNFDRPDFCRMIDDIERGKIGAVIVKDLSRLGREYLKTGYYTEIFFPEHDVRFIAVNDNVDSDHGENEFAPFKNIINEWYAKDCSRKIKSALHLKARNGEFLGGYPAYGYRRSEDDRHRLVPDENAPIVKQIFELLLDGKSCYEVAKYLEQNLILTPRAFLAEKYGVYKNSASAKHPYAWEDRSVYSIATNPVYVGDLVNGRRKCKSFKSKKVCKTSEDEWIVVRDNHEPLVSREDFEAVGQRLAVKQHRKVENPDNIFRGLMVCGECGRKMVFSKSGKSGRYSCAIYKRYGKSECSRHSITLKQIKQVVLTSIQRNAALSSEGKDRFVEQMLSASSSKKSAELSALKKEAEKLTARKLALTKIFQSLYEDKALGKLSEEFYSELSGNVERERTEIQERLKRISEQLGKSQQLTENAEKFAELIRQYTDITELSEELVHLLIEKIVVHERDCVTNTMQVEIYWESRLVCALGIALEFSPTINI